MKSEKEQQFDWWYDLFKITLVANPYSRSTIESTADIAAKFADAALKHVIWRNAGAS